jgi:2-furoyl-CoA dehydrogenase large subunit
VPHALDLPEIKTGYIESPSPFTPLGAKGMGEGGGAGLHAVAAALQDALVPLGAPVVTQSHNPYHRVWELIQDPEASRRGVTLERRS